MRKFIVLLILAVMAAPGLASAGYMTIPLPAYNFNTDNMSGGKDYPHGYSVLGGVPFDIPDQGDNNAWHSNTAASGGGGTVSIDIPVGLYGAATAHTLINTYWGKPTATARIEFLVGDTVRHSVDLIGNTHMRDFQQSSWTNSINPAHAQMVFSSYPQRLDMQTFILPAEFHTSMLTTIRLVDYGGPNYSRAFLSGLTVDATQAVPLPGAVWLLGSALAGLFGIRRKMRK